jgi:hypothetical protein
MFLIKRSWPGTSAMPAVCRPAGRDGEAQSMDTALFFFLNRSVSVPVKL